MKKVLVWILTLALITTGGFVIKKSYDDNAPYAAQQHMPIGTFAFKDRNFAINEEMKVTITPGNCDVYVGIIPYRDDPEWLDRSWESLKEDCIEYYSLPAKSTAVFNFNDSVTSGTGGGEYKNIFTVIVGNGNDWSAANFSIKA